MHIINTHRISAFGAMALMLLVLPIAHAQCETDVPGQADSQNADAVEGQLLVRFADDLTAGQIDEINARLGAEVIDRMSGGHVYLIQLAYPATRDDVLRAYNATEGVEYAEPNYAVSIPENGGEAPDAVPEDPSAPTIDLPQITD